MKLFFVFTLFLYPIATLGEDFCEESPMVTCSNPLKERFDNLRTPEDVKSICPKFIDYIACLGNFDATCGDRAQRKIFPSAGEFESVRDMIADICDENSLLHTALMEKIQCLRDGLYNDDNNTCYEDRTEVERSLYTPSDENSESDEHPFPAIAHCLYGLFSPTCYLEFVGESCGSLAKEAVIEVLHRSYFLGKFCEPEAANDFSEIMDKLEIRKPLKDILKELLQRILKKGE